MSNWDENPMIAGCGIDSDHIPPDPDCGCGLYAFHTLNQALTSQSVYGSFSLFPGADIRSSHELFVAGAVCGSGRVEVHSDGWRAERAQIIALLMVDHDHYCGDANLRMMFPALARSLGARLCHSTRELSDLVGSLDQVRAAPEEVIPEPWDPLPEIAPSGAWISPAKLWKEDRLSALALLTDLALALVAMILPAILYQGGADPSVVSLSAVFTWPLALLLIVFTPLLMWRERRLWRV